MITLLPVTGRYLCYHCRNFVVPLEHVSRLVEVDLSSLTYGYWNCPSCGYGISIDSVFSALRSERVPFSCFDHSNLCIQYDSEYRIFWKFQDDDTPR